MSFRQYGGINYAAKNNVVKNNYSNVNNLSVMTKVGQPNTYINFESDISGNILVYGDFDLSGNLYVAGDIDCSGNLYVDKDAYINSVRVGRGEGNIGTNTVVGNIALNSNTTGYYNTALGYNALNANIDGYDNTAVGVSALAGNISGYWNTAVGLNALVYNTTGYFNTAVGLQAGINTTNNGPINSIRCTFVGMNTFASSDNLNNSTAIGFNATINASYQIVLGTTNEKVFIPGNYLQIGGTYTDNSASYALYVNGNAYASSFQTPSDYRIKENIKILDESFTIDSLKPVTYFNKKTEKQDIGLIAHELQEIYPFLVTGEKDGENLQAVNYIGLISILIKEIQELKKEVKILKKY